MHPRVRKNFENWLCEHRNSNYIIKEAAILIESGAYAQLDKIIVVTAPVDVRVERVIMRDKIEREAVFKRIENQLSEEELMKYADFYIINDGEMALMTQVLDIHNKILEIC